MIDYDEYALDLHEADPSRVKIIVEFIRPTCDHTDRGGVAELPHTVVIHQGNAISRDRNGSPIFANETFDRERFPEALRLLLSMIPPDGHKETTDFFEWMARDTDTCGMDILRRYGGDKVCRVQIVRE